MKKKTPQIYERLFPLKTRKGTEAKIRIVRAAIDAMREDGVERLTFESVGKRIGLNPAQVRYHFVEKQDLIDRAIEYVIITYQECILKRLNEASEPVEQVKAIAQGTFDWIKNHDEERSTFLFFFVSAVTRQYHRDMHSKMFGSGEQRMGEILKEWCAARKMTAAESRSLAISIWAIIDGLLIYSLTTHSNSDDMFRQALWGIEKLLQ